MLRCVLPHAAGDLREFLATPLVAQCTAEGTLAATKPVSVLDLEDLALRSAFPEGSLVVEHDAIPFLNYPYEWAPEMLQSAAELTLQLGRAAMRAGFALKDATPYNIMFDGFRPVFLDLLSFRRRDPLESIWQPYAQYIRTFFYPLLACAHFGLRLDEILLAHRDGLEPERLMALCPIHRLLLPPFLGSITIPALLEHRTRSFSSDRYRPHRARDAQEANFILERLFQRAIQLLHRISLRRRSTEALRYMESNPGYSAAEFAVKERFLSHVFERWRPVNVLDIGCNTGHFSLLAARAGARAVAIDRDAGAAGALWEEAKQRESAVLPLVVDIARPPGACGWANEECSSFLARARGRFDCVLLLALLHHLVVNERVPLSSILELVSELTTRFAVIEFVDADDPQFRVIARGREMLHGDWNRASFESAARRWFQIVDSQEITRTRSLYLLRGGTEE